MMFPIDEDALLKAAQDFVPPQEVAGINELLRDPKTRPYGIDILQKLEQEHRINPRIENRDPQTSLQAFKALENRAINGDPQAWAEYQRVDVNQIPIH